MCQQGLPTQNVVRGIINKSFDSMGTSVRPRFGHPYNQCNYLLNSLNCPKVPGSEIRVKKVFHKTSFGIYVTNDSRSRVGRFFCL